MGYRLKVSRGTLEQGNTDNGADAPLLFRKVFF